MSAQLTTPALIRSTVFVNGKFSESASKKTFSVTNPSSSNRIADVPDCDRSDVRSAIEAAHLALPVWQKLTAKDRASVMRKWYDLIVLNTDDLAKILTLENGKPLEESRAEVLYGASFVDWFAEQGRRTDGDIIPAHRQDARIMVLKQPVGVVGAITPWNFPSAMITRKVAPAIAAGCTIVVKPAEQTPLSALALADLASRAGFPAGVVNIVTAKSGHDVGSEFCSNPLVRKVTFTGSTQVGRTLMAQCAPQIKKLSLELGGNAPFIVFDDADIDAAVEGAIICKFRNAGQTCVCANRLYVQSGIYNSFVDRLIKRVDRLKVGDGFAQDTDIGPIIDAPGLEKVKTYLADALEKGATIATTGHEHTTGSAFFPPTVLTDVSPAMKLASEEIFGPIAPIFKFEDEADVIAQSNDTDYGLAAYFYAQDLNRVWRVSEALEYGMVGINTGIISNEIGPFGGIKQSGLGREGSKYGIEDFLELKYLCLGNVA